MGRGEWKRRKRKGKEYGRTGGEEEQTVEKERVREKKRKIKKRIGGYGLEKSKKGGKKKRE